MPNLRKAGNRKLRLNPHTLLRIFLIWTLILSSACAQPANSLYVDLSHDESGRLFNCKGVTKRHIIKEFSIPDHPSVIYKIEIYEDSTSTLSISKNERWYILDTLSNHTWFAGDTSCLFMMPSIQLTDFNEDAHTDLSIWIHTNVNGNQWVELFLFNPTKNQIEILPNEAEGGTIWDAPEYRNKDSTIYCERIAGNWGLSFKSKYKMKGLQAIPLDKKEYDNTQMDAAGRGAIYKHYIGYNWKWKLIEKATYRPH